MKTFCSTLILFFNFFSPNNSSAQKDSLFAQEIIKENLKQLRAKKARVFKRIETKDSTVIYGADKLKTHLLHVDSHNRLKPLHVQYTYDEDGVILILVLRKSINMIGTGNKQKHSAYYFSKGKLIRGVGNDGSDDIEYLLSEAKRYLDQGKLYLEL